MVLAFHTQNGSDFKLFETDYCDVLIRYMWAVYANGLSAYIVKALKNRLLLSAQKPRKMEGNDCV